MDAQKIGNKIKSLRTERRATQAELANYAGVTKVAISNYERGLRVPRDEVKKKIADFLDTSIAGLFYS